MGRVLAMRMRAVLEGRVSRVRRLFWGRGSVGPWHISGVKERLGGILRETSGVGGGRFVGSTGA